MPAATPGTLIIHGARSARRTAAKRDDRRSCWVLEQQERRGANVAECTDAPHAVMEAALAHVVRGRAEAAHARSDLFAKRHKLIDAWAAYLSA